MNLALATHIAFFYNRRGRKNVVSIFGEDEVETVEELYSFLLKQVL